MDRNAILVRNLSTAYTVELGISPAQEDRLHALKERMDASDPEGAGPAGEAWETTRDILAGACFDRGLVEMERDDNLFWFPPGDRFITPPRRSLKIRLRAALKELRR